MRALFLPEQRQSGRSAWPRKALLGKDGGNRSSQRGLAMVDVADGADIDVRFGAFELSLAITGQEWGWLVGFGWN